MNQLEQINEAVRKGSPPLWALLSPVGRAAVYPADIPFQAQQARGARYNATIGQITDGRGHILQLPAIAGQLSGLDAAARNRGLLYSPIGGHAGLRSAWRRRERDQARATFKRHPPASSAASLSSDGALPPSSLPIVTSGLTHALALVADLVGGPGRSVLIPQPCWGNYRQVFALRTGSRMVDYPIYRDGEFWPEGLGVAAQELADEEPIVVVLNYPSNPGGYMPEAEPRARLVETLRSVAERRPVAVLCDEAYAGLVFDDRVSPRSLFWDLCGLHENLVPLRASGATKEFLLFGARVGFLSLPWADDHPITRALDDKLRCLLRAGVGSPVSLTQVILEHALERDGVEDEVAATIEVLGRRFVLLRDALLAAQERDDPGFRLLPCNAGAFMLLELAVGIDPELLRHHLLEAHSVGVVSVAPRYLRLAFCSTAEEDIDELVQRVARGIRELRERSAPTSSGA